MTQPAKGQEPSMEEILASIRRIIADDDPAKNPANNPSNSAAKAGEPIASQPPLRPAVLPPRGPLPPRPPMPPLRPAPLPETPAEALDQDEIDTMLAQLQASSRQAPEALPEALEEPAADILDLTEQMAAAEPVLHPQFHTVDGQLDVVFEESPPEPEPMSEPMPPAPAIGEARRQDIAERGLLSSATTAAVDSAFNTLAQTVLVQNGRTLEDLVREMLRPMLKTWLDDNLPSLVERLVRAEIERVSRGRG